MAFGGVNCATEIQRGLEARDVIMGVDQPVIHLPRDLQVGGDCLLLNCKGWGVVDLILVGVSVLAISLHLVQVFDDLIEVSAGDLIRMSGLVPFPSWVNRGMFVGLSRPLKGILMPILRDVHVPITLVGMHRGNPWFSRF